MPQELFELLQEDHDRIRGLLDNLSEPTKGSQRTRESGFKKLKDALIPHMRAEEQTIYASLEQHSESREVALEAIEEHHVADTVLSELLSTDMNDERWTAKLQVLQEIVERHIEEEESDVFDALEETFEDEELSEFARQIRVIKQEVRAGVT